MEVPRLGVKSEPQLLVYATATATRDPSHICDLHHSPEMLDPQPTEGQRSSQHAHGLVFTTTEPQWELHKLDNINNFDKTLYSYLINLHKIARERNSLT